MLRDIIIYLVITTAHVQHILCTIYNVSDNCLQIWDTYWRPLMRSTTHPTRSRSSYWCSKVVRRLFRVAPHILAPPWRSSKGHPTADRKSVQEIVLCMIPASVSLFSSRTTSLTACFTVWPSFRIELNQSWASSPTKVRQPQTSSFPNILFKKHYSPSFVCKLVGWRFVMLLQQARQSRSQN